MKTVMAVVLFVLSVFAPIAVPVAHAGNLEIDFIVVQYPYQSLEYADFVGIFNSVLIEELKKTDGKGFTPARWRLSISPVPQGKKVKIDVAPDGAKDSVLVAVLSENASFVSIHAVVEHVIETFQRGGVK